MELDLYGIKRREHRELFCQHRGKRRLRFGERKGLHHRPDIGSLQCRYGFRSFRGGALGLDLHRIERRLYSKLFGQTEVNGACGSASEGSSLTNRHQTFVLPVRLPVLQGKDRGTGPARGLTGALQRAVKLICNNFIGRLPAWQF